MCISICDDELEELQQWCAEQERKKAAAAAKMTVKNIVKEPNTTNSNESAEPIDSSKVTSVDGKRNRQPPKRYAPEKHIPKKRTKNN
ncbi:hypothetical protein CAEBREN_19565 [Caenorhabditis brenneri]|uniref:Uncharacterized protein n=1 Tax=Caenorhabditis brenneri TaxID=135651 RepID=G0PDE1_CAEBE|nr:hypothetical protein CAEBREN_19565 [Caenorhabditis brenneri]